MGFMDMYCFRLLTSPLEEDHSRINCHLPVELVGFLAIGGDGCEQRSDLIMLVITWCTPFWCKAVVI